VAASSGKEPGRSDVDLDSIADELLAAYRTGETLPPLTSTYPGLTIDQAYAIQQRQTPTRANGGAGIVGFKIGLTSPAMQQQLGVDQPDYGHLFTDMLHGADTPIRASAFLQPRAEPEIALVLARPLHGPGLSVANVLSATAYALPAIEIIDSRNTDWRIGLEDTIADNASSGGLVLGGTPTAIAGRDLSLLGCVRRAQRPHPAHRGGCRGHALAASGGHLAGEYAYRPRRGARRRARHPHRVPHRRRGRPGRRQHNGHPRPPGHGHRRVRLTERKIP
jgi:2-keto-4-pentenoate hydratase